MKGEDISKRTVVYIHVTVFQETSSNDLKIKLAVLAANFSLTKKAAFPDLFGVTVQRT